MRRSFLSAWRYSSSAPTSATPSGRTTRRLRTGSPANREIDAFMQKLKKKPNDVETRMRLAQALSVAGRNRDAVEQYQAGSQAQQGVGPGAVRHRLRADEAEGLEGRRGVLQEGHHAHRGQDARRCQAGAPARSPTTTWASRAWSSGTTRARWATSRKRCECAATRRTPPTRSPSCYGKLGHPRRSARDARYTLQFDPKMPEANYDYGLMLLADGKSRRRRRALPDVGRRGSLQAGAEGRAREARHGECAARRSREARVDGCQRGARRGARRRRHSTRESVESLAARGQALRETQEAHARPPRPTRRSSSSIPGNATATAGLKRVKNGS